MFKPIKTLIAITSLATVVSITPTDKANAMVTATNQTSVESVANRDNYGTGWEKKNGKWYYYNKGVLCKNQWIEYNGSWYNLDANGAARTGWQKLKSYETGKYTKSDDTYWFYFSPSSCKMFTGLQKIGKYYYYFNEMFNQFDVRGCKAPKGACKLGDCFVYINNDKLYHIQKNGRLSIGWVIDRGNWYYITIKNGAVTGWQTLPTSNKSTTKANYYFNEKHIMQTGMIKIDSKYYYFNPHVSSGLGKQLYGWKKLDTYWYYFDKSNGGAALVSTNKLIKNKRYVFDKKGHCINP